MTILQIAALMGVVLVVAALSSWRWISHRRDNREITQEELISWFRRNRN